MPRTNLLLNPSWEAGTGRWTYSAAGGGALSETQFLEMQAGSIVPIAGTRYCAFRRSTAGRLDMIAGQFTAVTAGQTYAASIHFNRDGTGAAQLDIDWYTNTGSGYISSSSATLNPAAGTWARIGVVGAAPTGANYCRVWLHWDNMLAANFVRVDAALLEANNVVDTYFDGSFDNASWNGATNDSSSTLADATPMSSLYDTFSGATLSAEWTAAGGATTQNGRMAVPVSRSGTNPIYASARSRAMYSMMNASLRFRATMPGVAGDNASAQMWVMDSAPADTVARVGFEYQPANGILQCIGQSGATYAPIGTTVNLTYDPAAHRYLAVSYNGTALTWLTSPSGVQGTWTTRRTLNGPPAWITKQTLRASFEGFRTTGTNDLLLIDGLNGAAVIAEGRYGQGYAGAVRLGARAAGTKATASQGRARHGLIPRGLGRKHTASLGQSPALIHSTRTTGRKQALGVGLAPPLGIRLFNTVPPTIPTFTGRPLPEDPLPLADVRYMVQNVLTGEWLHTDLPLSDDQVTLTLSGPCEISGKITPEMADLRVPVKRTVVTTVPGTPGKPVEPVAALTANGIQNAAVIVEAARIVGIDLAHAVAMVQKESGGRHIWGNDNVTVAPNTYTKGGPVTAANYRAFRSTRDRGDAAAGIRNRMQAGQTLYEDWTWQGCPQEVNAYNDSLQRQFGGKPFDTARAIPFLSAIADKRPGWQGIGITQLTHYSFLDQAQAIHPDGPADMLTNCRVGFAQLKKLQTANGVQDGARAYNGSGSAAEAYGADYMLKLARWQTILSATTGGTTTTATTTTIVGEEPLLRSWGHMLYFEMGGEIRAAGLITEDSYDDQTQTLMCKGVSAYPSSISYQGNYRRYFADPIDVAQQMWDYVQGFSNGNLGVGIERMGGRPRQLYGASVNIASGDNVLGVKIAPNDEANTSDDQPVIPIRQSTTLAGVYARLRAAGFRNRGLIDPSKTAQDAGNVPPADTIFVTKAGLEQAYLDYFLSAEQTTGFTLANPPDQTSSVCIEPFKFDWWDVKSCGDVINDAAKYVPCDYVEQYKWNYPHTYVDQTVMLAHPRLGRRRDDLRFVQGENIVNAPSLEADPDSYATCVIGIGAGEGSESLRETAEVIVPGRTRKTYVYRNARITDRAELRRMVQTLLAAKQLGGHSINSIIVAASHDNAKFGSYNVGDDILVQTQIPYFGWVTQWGRITSMTLARADDLVQINLKRTDSFFYGREAETS